MALFRFSLRLNSRLGCVPSKLGWAFGLWEFSVWLRDWFVFHLIRFRVLFACEFECEFDLCLVW